MTETIDQLRTLYEREKAKNQKMRAVVEAARRLGAACFSMHRADEINAHVYDAVMHHAVLTKKALAALGEK